MLIVASGGSATTPFRSNHTHSPLTPLAITPPSFPREARARRSLLHNRVVYSLPGSSHQAKKRAASGSSHLLAIVELILSLRQTYPSPHIHAHNHSTRSRYIITSHTHNQHVLHTPLCQIKRLSTNTIPFRDYVRPQNGSISGWHRTTHAPSSQ